MHTIRCAPSHNYAATVMHGDLAIAGTQRYVPRFVRRHCDANMRDRRLLGLLLCLTRDDFKRALDGAFQRHAAVEPRVFWPGLALLWVFIRSPGEPLRFGNIGVPGPGRIDNLRKVHN